jgi:hypothetical protein
MALCSRHLRIPLQHYLIGTISWYPPSCRHWGEKGGMILAKRIMPRSTSTARMCRKLFMRMLQGFRTIGLHAGSWCSIIYWSYTSISLLLLHVSAWVSTKIKKSCFLSWLCANMPDNVLWISSPLTLILVTDAIICQNLVIALLAFYLRRRQN